MKQQIINPKRKTWLKSIACKSRRNHTSLIHGYFIEKITDFWSNNFFLLWIQFLNDLRFEVIKCRFITNHLSFISSLKTWIYFSLAFQSFKLQFHHFNFTILLAWVHCFCKGKSEFVNSWSLHSIESNNSVILWNCHQMVWASRPTECWWLVAFVGNESQGINTVSASEFYLIDILILGHIPNVLTSSQSSNSRCVLFSNTIAQV